jgi:ribosomal protein L22
VFENAATYNYIVMPMVDQFTSASSVDDRSQVLTEIIRRKLLHEVARDPTFRAGLNELAVVARKSDHPERLLALSMLCKTAGLVRDLRPLLTEKISEALSTPLSEPNGLPDPDDRYYLATFWRYAVRPWAPQLLSQWMAEEEAAEKVRIECAEGLISTTSSYVIATNLLSQSLRNLRLRAHAPGDSTGRRFKRCIAAIREAIVSSTNDEPGDGLGPALSEMIRNAFAESGLPKKRVVIEDAAEETLSLLLILIRKRISIALQGDIYSVLFSLRDWFDSSHWIRFTEGELPQRIGNDIADSLENAVKSGRADKQLLSTLLLISGSKERNAERLKRIIDRNLGLSTEMTAWLQGKQVPRETPLSVESQMSRMDTQLAELILLAALTAHLRAEIERDLLPGLAIFPSLSDKALRQLLDATSRTTTLTNELASERKLRSFGEVGAKVRYSPLEHEFGDLSELGSRVVQIVRPGVLMSSSDGRQRVVRKAIVRNAEE